MAKCVIDLATTNSLIAYTDHTLTEQPEARCITNQDGTTKTPSCVCFTDQDSVLVGESAKNCKYMFPETYKQEFKREMGKTEESLKAFGKSYSPQHLSALILKRLLMDAEAELGEKAELAAVTVPAYYPDAAREAVLQACEMAGQIDETHQVRLINEPTAAGFYTIHTMGYDTGTFLIIDLGGGTLDVSVLRAEGNHLKELVIDGDLQCGGADWDRVFGKCLEKQIPAGYSLDEEGKRDLADKTERAKIDLSKKEVTKFTLMTSGGRVEITASRKEFEDCTTKCLDKVRKVLERLKATLEKQGISQPDKIFFCGGSTRMPQIKRLTNEVFPDIEVLEKDVDEAVAKGAALYVYEMEKKGILDAEEMGQTDHSSQIHEITFAASRSYGLAAVDDGREKVINLIHMNAEIPAEAEKTFYTRYDHQYQAALRVFENTEPGEKTELAESNLLGKCILKIQGDLPAGSPIQVFFRLKEDGTLFLRGFEPSGKTEVTAELKTTNGLIDRDSLQTWKEQIEDIFDEAV